mgnify:CR=1 FL=1
MHSTIQPFDFRGHEVRVLHGDDGEPRWVAADVADVLGYRMASDMTRGLDDDEKGTQIVRTPSGDQSMTTITESGLYSVILRSRVPAARDFKRWVTREVLPQIRKRGGYLTPEAVEQTLTDPDFIIRLATDLKEERARRAEAEEHARRIEPAARSWETMAAAGGDYSVAEAAKVLSRDPAIRIGRNRLFAYMHQLGWLFRTRGHRAHWEASQKKALDTGRLVHKISRPFLNERTGEMETPPPTVRITHKGLHELHKHLGGSADIKAVTA